MFCHTTLLFATYQMSCRAFRDQSLSQEEEQEKGKEKAKEKEEEDASGTVCEIKEKLSPV